MVLPGRSGAPQAASRVVSGGGVEVLQPPLYLGRGGANPGVSSPRGKTTGGAEQRTEHTTRLVTPLGSADDGKRLGLSESALDVALAIPYSKWGGVWGGDWGVIGHYSGAGG